MVSFFTTYLLFAFAVLTALAHPSQVDKRQANAPDWGNYVYMAGSYAGLAGQNTAGVSVPANRALCPAEVWNLQACAGTFESECLPERSAFEWCILHRLPVNVCGTLFLNTTITCTSGAYEDCTYTLGQLYNCALANAVPSPVPSGF